MSILNKEQTLYWQSRGAYKCRAAYTCRVGVFFSLFFCLCRFFPVCIFHAVFRRDRKLLTFRLNYCRGKCLSNSSAAPDEGWGGEDDDDHSRFYSLIRQDAEGWGYGESRPSMQLMGLVLGDGCLCICLWGSQRRDLGGRRALLSRGGALPCWRGYALVGIIRRVLVGYERSGGFLQADQRVTEEANAQTACQQSAADQSHWKYWLWI